MDVPFLLLLVWPWLASDVPSHHDMRNLQSRYGSSPFLVLLSSGSHVFPLPGTFSVQRCVPTPLEVHPLCISSNGFRAHLPLFLFSMLAVMVGGGARHCRQPPPPPMSLFLSGPQRLRVQSRSRMRLRIAVPIAFLFRTCLKRAFRHYTATIARLSPLSGLERGS